MARVADFILLVVGCMGMIVSLVAMVLVVVYALRVMACLKPGLRWRDAPMFNPLNYMLDARNLTEEGLRYRRRLSIAAMAFCIPILVTMALAMIMGKA